MNKHALAVFVSKKANITLAQAKKVVDAFLSAITEELKQGSRFQMHGLGTFHVTKREAKSGRNPRTGAVMQVPSQHQAKFVADSALVSALGAIDNAWMGDKSINRLGREKTVLKKPPSAYALLKAKSRVKPDTVFDLDVGLSAKQVKGVSGGKFQLPSTNKPYLLTVLVHHEGFSRVEHGEALPQQETSIVELTVTPGQKLPSSKIKLMAITATNESQAKSILAMYSYRGQIVGSASRSILLEGINPTHGTQDVKFRANLNASKVQVNKVHNRNLVDMTITIRPRDDRPEYLVWDIRSRHAHLQTNDLTESDRTARIGDEPDSFAYKLMQSVAMKEGSEMLPDYLIGVGSQISACIPNAIQDRLLLLNEICQAKGKTGAILIVSEEAHIPWELARLPFADEDEYLGINFAVGRWMEGRYNARKKQDIPSLPPPNHLKASSLSVVSGDYSAVSGWNKLVHAEQEAQLLMNRYKGRLLNANYTEIKALAKNSSPKSNMWHFSMHGKVGLTGTDDGLILLDGNSLGATIVSGFEISQSPFVFLNACQVGMGDNVLGQYSGLAAAFLQAGACAVVAPLWPIDDEIAQEIALQFYRGLEGNTSPAELVRVARKNSKDHTTSGTYMAYQFFGHPKMNIGFKIRS